MIEEERKKVQVKLEDDMNKFTSTMEVYNKLPAQGRSSAEISKEAKIYLDLGNILFTRTIAYNLSLMKYYLKL